MRTQRNMYYNAHTIDLKKMQEDARRISEDTRFVTEAPVVVIHHHPIQESCQDKKHESFINGKAQS